eukprot:6338891-Amphidinium_carterae.1
MGHLQRGDVVAYDPRVYHRGGACREKAITSPREVLWFTLANDGSAAAALDHAMSLPHNPFLQELWHRDELVSEQSLKRQRQTKHRDL